MICMRNRVRLDILLALRYNTHSTVRYFTHENIRYTIHHPLSSCHKSSNNKGGIGMKSGPRRHHSTDSSNPPYSLDRPSVAKDWTVHPMMSIPIVCFLLGYWQVERRKSKLQLLADIESRCDLTPEPFDSAKEYLEYTPVIITGEYDYSFEFYLGPRHEVVEGRDKGVPGGYHSIVPMTLDTGERVLVDRGWVQTRTNTPAGQISGRLSQVGLIRHAEGAVMGALAPKPGSSQTYIWRDSAVMGEVSGSLPITIELAAQHSIEDGPLAGQTRLSLYNKHMEYIITWWSMGIASLFYVFRYKRKPKSIPKIFK